uniref:Uncharacterized protein n=1 Tax=Arundo donax TaxID=35708 RepID=A0A0A9GHC9_ARUDO
MYMCTYMEVQNGRLQFSVQLGAVELHFCVYVFSQIIHPYAACGLAPYTAVITLL